MKIKSIFFGILLLLMISCSTNNNSLLKQLPPSNEIAYICVKVNVPGGIEKKAMTYDLDEDGEMILIPNENEKEEDNFSKNKYRELFRISNPKVITNLMEKLKNDTTDEANVTFSGTLPSAIFIDKNEKPIFSVSIICDDSSIFINKQIISLKNNVITFNSNKKPIANGINRPYVKAFFQILKQNAPEEVKKLERRYKAQGGVGKLLCIE